MIQLTDSQVSTFWAHCRVQGGCWMWQGPINANGDAIYYFDEEVYLAYDVAAYLHSGIDFEGDMGHICGSRICCNPNHSRRVQFSR